MKYKISNRLFEQLDNVLEPKIVKLFKFLNEEKQKHKTRAKLLDVIKNVSQYMGLPEGHEIYLLELYLLNFRKDGDYKNLTKENFVDPRKMKGKWTSNTKADSYTIAQLPFKGTNLEGFWSSDNNGTPYYIVKSYGWYPIYIYKNDRWYEVAEHYSSSTGRQMSNANPVAWNENLDGKVFLLTKEEMKMLEKGATHDDVIQNKKISLKSKESELQNKRMSSAKQYSWAWNEQGERTPFIAKFKINSIDDSGDKIKVIVDIHDVLDFVDGKGQKTTKNYLKGEMGDVTKEYVEKAIKRKLNSELRPYIGPRHRHYEELPSNAMIEYSFNHLKK